MTSANARRLGFLVGTPRPGAGRAADRIWIMDRSFPGAARRDHVEPSAED